MTFANVEQTVLKTAEAEAQEILDAARRESEERLQRRTEAMRAEHQKRVEQTQADLSGQMESDVSARQTEGRLQLLAAKNEMLNNAFDAAKQQILGLSGGAYRQWLKAQVRKLPENRKLVLSPGKRDREMLAEVVKESGLSNLSVGPQSSTIERGFIARGDGMDLDFSLEALMNVQRDRMLQEIARSLFSQEDQ